MTQSRKSSSLALAAVTAAIGLLAAAPAWASQDDHVPAREALKRGEILPLSRILAVVATRVPGDVIDVELERKKGVWRYEVKVLTPSGVVKEVKLDARTAAVLKIEDD
jgi:uncharacterized membrane protein YkoI